MPKYSFKNNLFFSIWGGGQHTTPADQGLPKPPHHTALCAGCDIFKVKKYFFQNCSKLP